MTHLLRPAPHIFRFSTRPSPFPPAGKNKDLGGLLVEVEDVLDYSRKLAKFADEEDLMPGLGHVSLAGGVLAQAGKAREVGGGAGNKGAGGGRRE